MIEIVAVIILFLMVLAFIVDILVYKFPIEWWLACMPALLMAMVIVATLIAVAGSKTDPANYIHITQ